MHYITSNGDRYAATQWFKNGDHLADGDATFPDFGVRFACHPIDFGNAYTPVT